MSTASGSPESWRARLAHSPVLGWPFRLWIGWAVVLLIFQAAAWARLDVRGPDTSYGWTEQHSVDPPRSGIGGLHVRWDSFHYLRLARLGYHRAEDAAYYPAYPVLMRGVALAIMRPLRPHASELEQYAAAGLVVSLLASLVAVWALVALARACLGDDVAAQRAVFYLLIFPTALFLVQVYTEALYLALAIPTLLGAVRRQWWAAGVLAALATITRVTGILLVAALAVEWLREARAGRRPAWITLLALALPLIAWQGHALFLRWSGLDLGDAYASYGRRVLNLAGLREIVDQLGHMLTDRMGAVQISLDVALPLLGLGLCWRFRREWPGLALYGALALLVPLSTGTLVSLNRYTLVAVPVFLGLARLGARPLFDRLWTLISVLLLALYLIGFSHGYWTG